MHFKSLNLRASHLMNLCVYLCVCAFANVCLSVNVCSATFTANFFFFFFIIFFFISVLVNSLCTNFCWYFPFSIWSTLLGCVFSRTVSELRTKRSWSIRAEEQKNAGKWDQLLRWAFQFEFDALAHEIWFSIALLSSVKSSVFGGLVVAMQKQLLFVC